MSATWAEFRVYYMFFAKTQEIIPYTGSVPTRNYRNDFDIFRCWEFPLIAA